MATEETKTYFVKLQKNFPVSHRRAGVVLAPGPVPVQVELTEDQYNEINRDPAFVFVDQAAAEEVTTAQEVVNSVDEKSSGRSYDDEEVEETEDEKLAREAAEKAEQEEATRRAEKPTAKELVDDNNKEALVAKATEAGVEGLDFTDRATTKAMIAEAIVAKRDSQE